MTDIPARETQSEPSRAGGWRIGGFLRTPWRIYRERTSLQLIVSNVSVAVISLLLFFITMVSVVIFAPAWSIPGTAYDYSLGEHARGYAVWLDGDELDELLVDGFTPAERIETTARLEAIVNGTVPGFEGTTPAGGDRISRAVLFDTDGRIIASTDEWWLAPFASIQDFPNDALVSTAETTLDLQGEINPDSNTVYALGQSDERTAASTPVLTSDGEMVAGLALEGGPISEILGTTAIEFWRETSTQILQIAIIFAIPALIVAVPFGIWRSRSIARRLNRLARAADRMAGGAMETRILIRQNDEIGQLAHRFNQMAQQIEANELGRRAFISNVSHELRTPVSVIHGTVERYLGQHEGEEEHESIQPMETVQHEAEVLSRLIDDLFTLTRLEEHNLRLERTELQVAAVCHDAVAGIRDLAWEQQKVSVEALVPGDLPLITGDRTRILQVMNNLLYNALRHTPEGGIIIVQGKALPTHVEITISDTGVGISPEAVENVFNRYYQAERQHRHPENSGLGLSIVKQLVEAHGGEITVESILGQGTTFRFTLPRAKVDKQ